jgi:hypothetical protein
LQALAKANGGSLTVNPDTGLVEAGFLSDILPVVAAAGLTYLTAGAAAPALAAATGLGATSAGIIAGAGAGALINGGMASMQGKDVGKAALMGGLGGGLSGGLGAYGDANVFGVGTEAGTAGLGEAGQSAALTQTGTQLPTSVQPTSAAQLVEGVDGAGGLAPQDAINAANKAAMPTQEPFTSSGNRFISTSQTLTPTDAAGYVSPTGTSTTIPTGTPNAIPNTAAQSFKDQAANQYYQKLGDTGFAPVQKMGIQALPVLSTLDEQQALNPVPEEPSKLGRISPNFRAQEAIKPNPYYQATYAQGGIASLPSAQGTVEDMSRQNSLGNNSMFPQAGLGDLTNTNTYQNPINTPTGTDVIGPTDSIINPYTGQMSFATGGDVSKKKQRAKFTADRNMAAMDPYQAGIANLNNARYMANMSDAHAPSSMTSLGDIPTAAGGGLSSLGSYSDGGRMLKGPGDGMSDHIPATIGGKQPARLADGEFVVPADVVSHLGNGSTDAGAKRLYSMMDKVRRARTGKKKQAPAVNTAKFMPV